MCPSNVSQGDFDIQSTAAQMPSLPMSASSKHRVGVSCGRLNKGDMIVRNVE